LPESGAYYDQPSFYIECMLEMDGAMADKYDIAEKDKKVRIKEEDEKLDKIRALGLNITKKK
jgi:hypothetical protein